MSIAALKNLAIIAMTLTAFTTGSLFALVGDHGVTGRLGFYGSQVESQSKSHIK